MRVIGKRCIVYMLVLGICMGIMTDRSSGVGADPVVAHAAVSNYNQYSNQMISWYIRRSTDHSPSKGAMTSQDLEKYQAYYYDNKTSDKVMYLTFDCGYENGYTAKILDTLKKQDVKAVFFVTKQFVKTQPDLCRRMKQEGHLVGNHTMNHPSLPKKSVSQIQKEVRDLENYFKEQTGYTMDKYFRPPSGEFSKRVLKVVQDMGYTTVFWSMAYLDYDPEKQPGKQYVIDHFKSYHHNGAIPLMHNISQSNAEALDDVLSYLKTQGYLLMRIDAVGKSHHITPKTPQWKENLYRDGRISPTSIDISFFVDMQSAAQKPDGFELYRREAGNNYELIASIKSNSGSEYNYTDLTVEAGKTYYYAVKSYCYRYGKKYVTAMPRSMKKSAVNPSGKYVIKWKKSKPRYTNEIIVKVSADKYNAVSKFTPETYQDPLVLSDGVNTLNLVLSAYSQDCVKWHSLTKEKGLTAVLEPSKEIYLKFRIKGNTFLIDSKNKKNICRINDISLLYNDFRYSMNWDLSRATGISTIIK